MLQLKAYGIVDWPEEAGGWPEKKGDSSNVYNYNNCVEELPGQQGLITTVYSYPDPKKGEDICLHMSTSRYCDEQIYSMDFKLDGMCPLCLIRGVLNTIGKAYQIATKDGVSWQSYRFGKV
jgi:hypothetical protein